MYGWKENKEVEEKTYVNGVELMGESDGIKVVGICALIDALFPDYFENSLDYTYAAVSDAVMKWCEENDSAYYADVREEFWVGHGISEAKEAGKSVVVVEDLS